MVVLAGGELKPGFICLKRITVCVVTGVILGFSVALYLRRLKRLHAIVQDVPELGASQV